jgi:hypothetical protein
LSKRSVLNELEHAGWRVIPIPSEEVTSSLDFFQGLWPQVAFQLLRTETVYFASPAGSSIAENPDPDIEPPLGDSEDPGTHIESPFRNPDEVLDVMGDVLDQVLGGPPEFRPVQPPFGALKDAHQKLTPLQRLAVVHAKFMRLSKSSKELEKELTDRKNDLAHRDRELESLRAAVESLPPPSPPPTTDDMRIGHQILQELDEQIDRDPKQRRSSSVLVTFSSTLHLGSAQAYRLLCQGLPFPSPRRLQELTRPEKIKIMTVLDEQTGPGALPEDLQDYRERHELGDLAISSILALDAIPVTATGLPTGKKDSGSCFAFMVSPLDGRWPVFRIQSIVRSDGKIKDDILAITEK